MTPAITRRCFRCREVKPLLAFAVGNYDCKECHRPVGRASYQKRVADPERRKALNAYRLALYYRLKAERAETRSE